MYEVWTRYLRQRNPHLLGCRGIISRRLEAVGDEIAEPFPEQAGLALVTLLEDRPQQKYRPIPQAHQFHVHADEFSQRLSAASRSLHPSITEKPNNSFGGSDWID